MICYYFPPVTDVGSKRSVAFSKYFRKHGWNPCVLSVKNPDRYYCSVGSDEPPDGVLTQYCHSVANVSWVLGILNGALSRLLSLFGIEVTRNYFHDFFCYPDRFLGWIPLATLRGARMIREHDIDVIYVSCSPFSAALVGVLLKKVTGRPLVLDFRDPFVTGVASYFTPSRVRQTILTWFERKFLQNADVLLVTSNETRAEYVKAYPDIAPKTFTIYNGFDPVVPTKERPKKSEKFSIIYTGQFYRFGPHHQVYTDQFFKALAHLKATGDISAENFQFLFFGDDREYINQTALRHGVGDVVAARARVPYRELVQSISGSHLMLLRIVKLMISTKLFDGIPLNVPFLATIPHGEVEDIIREYSPGSYVVTEDQSHLAVAEAIRDAMEKYKRDQMPTNNVEEFLARFTRERLALQAMRIIDDRLTSPGSTR
jgi:glycosyltransferase involved in cell wall biosynthesis